ncbi:MAG: ring-cleaving dioxygenase [Phycisphaerae bacterium]|nr:ring-cleaving dioxygenase [Phycisphaerae bacterium]
MTLDILGIHHVTAITGKPQANLDFYTRTLGLKLVKQTVNFDDPRSYHLYYGDGLGRPGTLLTFFLWPDVSPATVGPGQTCSIALAAPLEALSFWEQRLACQGVAVQRLPTSDGLDRLTFRDPDGISLEILAGTADRIDQASSNGLITPQFALRGIHAVTLLESALAPTRDFLQTTFQFTSHGGSTCQLHSQAHDQHVTARIHLLEQRNQPRGRIGAGYIHHLAFRAADEPSQQQWFQHLIAMKYNVSPIMDRIYFRSIYFREPGGVLFEIATDGPGFTVDEPVAVLGKRLQLPAWLEAQRADIIQTLPPLQFD